MSKTLHDVQIPKTLIVPTSTSAYPQTFHLLTFWLDDVEYEVFLLKQILPEPSDKLTVRLVRITRRRTEPNGTFEITSQDYPGDIVIPGDGE